LQACGKVKCNKIASSRRHPLSRIQVRWTCEQCPNPFFPVCTPSSEPQLLISGLTSGIDGVLQRWNEPLGRAYRPSHVSRPKRKKQSQMTKQPVNTKLQFPFVQIRETTMQPTVSMIAEYFFCQSINGCFVSRRIVADNPGG
jgi:hypothetical protein